MSTPLRRAWIPAILWLLVIALESTSLGSAANTGSVLRVLLTFLFGKINVITYSHIHETVRKAGHFCGYAVLSLVMFRAWWATLTVRRADAGLPSWRDMLNRWAGRAALFALFSTIVVASLDEWHQTMLANRTGSLRDVILDSFAGTFTQLLLIAISSVERLRTRLPLAVGR